jgi:acyl-CoA synthetase (AMP-forming)/AMP-acid ligase II
MISLVACFKAGVIAVPVFPPDPRRQKKDLHHFISIQSSSGATVALTHTLYNAAKRVSDIKHIFSSSDHSWPELRYYYYNTIDTCLNLRATRCRWISVDGVISSSKTKGDIPSVNHTIQADDVAFLQYTSGSTSEPKGVMISHMNLAHNEMLIARELKTSPETICVSWLPQYHDVRQHKSH